MLSSVFFQEMDSRQITLNQKHSKIRGGKAFKVHFFHEILKSDYVISFHEKNLIFSEIFSKPRGGFDPPPQKSALMAKFLKFYMGVLGKVCLIFF